MLNSEFPDMTRLNRFGSDTFMDDSLRLTSPAFGIESIFQQITTYINHMMNLLEKKEPVIDEATLKTMLSALYPKMSAMNLINKAIEHKVVSRKAGPRGRKLIAVV